MTLVEALQIAGKAVPSGATPRRAALLGSFAPVYLEVFFKARLRQRFPDDALTIQTGIFDDLAGSLLRAAGQPPAESAVLVEWPDLDARLSPRKSAGWGVAVQEDILASAAQQAERIRAGIAALAAVSPVAVSGPTLPLPPLGHTHPATAAPFELSMELIAARLLAGVAAISGVTVISSQALAQRSPSAQRFSLKQCLLAGMPYTAPHADAIAELVCTALFPQPARKAIITDLDNTLWQGILGEDGPEGIAWDFDRHAQAHGIYQQMLSLLAERGVLVGIASKNDPVLVERALERTDLLLKPEQIYPIAAGWGSKSESVRQILTAWNIGAADVIFIDDSPMELAEVKAAFPEIECLPFPTKDPNALWTLLGELRSRFGRPRIQAEDAFRARSLRANLDVTAAAPSSAEFLKSLGGKITLDWRKSATDLRPLELINKTNQFNLNGRRLSEGEWRALLADDSSFLLTVSYEDKFGPLGRIAVACGERKGDCHRVTHWVMSCRAFSRCIEDHTLRALFRQLNAGEAEFCFARTERNQPLQEFLGRIATLPDESGCLTIHARDLPAAEAADLPHEEILHG